MTVDELLREVRQSIRSQWHDHANAINALAVGVAGGLGMLADAVKHLADALEGENRRD